MTEWVMTRLGEVGTFERGRRFTKDQYVDSGLGCIHYGQLYTHLGPVTREALTFLPDELRSRLRLAAPGDVVVAATSENVADLGKATAWLGGDDVAVHDDCYIFRHSLDPAFASHLFASAAFQEQKVQFAAGTKVTRISGANLAKIQVSIPSLSEQRRIVDAIAAVDAQVAALGAEIDRLSIVFVNRVASAHRGFLETGTATRLGDVLAERKRPILVEPNVDYRQIGIRSHARGIFTKDAVTGAELGSKKVYWVEPGDLVINIVFAWEGAVAKVPAGLDGYCASHRFPTYRRVDDGDVDYFRFYFTTPEGQALLSDCSPGGAGRNRTLNRRRLMDSTVFLPDRRVQDQVVGEFRAQESILADLHTELARLRTFRSTVLDALLSQEIEIPEEYDDLLAKVS